MNEFGKEIKDAAVSIGPQTFKNAEEIANALMHIAEVFGATIKQLQEALMIAARNTGDITAMTGEEIGAALNCMEPCRQETKPIHKMCFVRPRIVHQVSSRKPRHLIKKIIR
ncbi:hypothetical protein ACOMCU_24755 [Lysinibacillus sp. UGB7]|uniref:hypothetical protein n=1 Tax=Lysinibacillus sp. UGB7 TaxID=3411039 RepID=UPI003B7B0BDB